jgi:DNA-binding transcriptional MocR family regulator
VTDPAPLRVQVKFAIIPEWVLWHPKLSPLAVRLYGTLHRYGDQTGVSFPGRTTLARHCGASVRSVDAAVAELEAVGALTHRRRWTDDTGGLHYEAGPGRRQTSSEYTLTMAQGVGADSAGIRAAQGVQDLRTNETQAQNDISRARRKPKEGLRPMAETAAANGWSLPQSDRMPRPWEY